MSWTITVLSADLAQNQGTVIFTRPGGTSNILVNITASFQLVPLGNPTPTNIDRDDLIAQAKTYLNGAGNSTAQVQIPLE